MAILVGLSVIFYYLIFTPFTNPQGRGQRDGLQVISIEAGD